MEAPRPPPPFRTTYSAQNARTKARPWVFNDDGRVVSEGKAPRTLSEVEWRCVLVTWAVSGWTCRCTPTALDAAAIYATDATKLAS